MEICWSGLIKSSKERFVLRGREEGGNEEEEGELKASPLWGWKLAFIGPVCRPVLDNTAAVAFRTNETNG